MNKGWFSKFANILHSMLRIWIKTLEIQLFSIKVKKTFYFDRFECGSWNSNIQWFLAIVFHNQFGQLDWIKSWNSAHQSCQSLIIRKPWNNVEISKKRCRWQWNFDWIQRLGFYDWNSTNKKNPIRMFGANFEKKEEKIVKSKSAK